MKYSPLDHVRSAIDNMGKGGNHYDHESGNIAVDRIKKEAPNEYHGVFDRFLNATHEHGSHNQLSELLGAKETRTVGRGPNTSEIETDKFKHNLTTSQLTKLWKTPQPQRDDVHIGIKEDLLQRPNVPPSLLREAGTHLSSYIREAAVRHQNAPEDMIRSMTKDSSPDVASEARRVAKARRVKLT